MPTRILIAYLLIAVLFAMLATTVLVIRGNRREHRRTMRGGQPRPRNRRWGG